MTRTFRLIARFLGLWLMIAIALPAAAVEGEEVRYIGGTVPFLRADTIGKLDFTNAQELRFVTPSGTLALRYGNIESYQYSEQFTHNLGKLPGAAVSVMRHRKMRHFYRFTFRDEQNALQSVILEVPKHMPPLLNATLETRVQPARTQTATAVAPPLPPPLPAEVVSMATPH